jgi:threonine/homoserine/homoserine lactone efflux protein
MLYATVFIITPGPNNILMANSGALYGFKKTIPLMCGAIFGAPIILLLIAFGGNFILHYALVRETLRGACVFYLLYLAYKIAMAAPPQHRQTAKPVNLKHAFAIQWVNPKVWSQYVIAVSVYANVHHDYTLQIFVMLLAVILISIPSAIVWVFFGKIIARYLRHALHYRIFNITMAILLLAAVLPTLIEHFK